MRKCKIISIKRLGVMPSCNVTMKSRQHNYAITNKDGLVVYTKNSHSCAYAYESFKTAYLKANFFNEFMAARLTVEARRRKFDEVRKYELDWIQKDGDNVIRSTDINLSRLEYTIEGNNVLRRPLLIKGIGDKAAQNIIKNQPYKKSDIIYSMAIKTDQSVNKRVIEALFDSGLFKEYSKDNKSLKNKEYVLDTFNQIRTAFRKSKQKGRPHGDLFG